MSSPGWASADAGQAFEAIQTKHVISAMHNLYELAVAFDKRGDRTITIINSQSAVTRYGGYSKQPFSGRVVLWASKALKCSLQLLKLRIFKAGSAYLVQNSGVPIGGGRETV
jgi:hypothetical protein